MVGTERPHHVNPDGKACVVCKGMKATLWYRAYDANGEAHWCCKGSNPGSQVAGAKPEKERAHKAKIKEEEDGWTTWSRVDPSVTNPSAGKKKAGGAAANGAQKKKKAPRPAAGAAPSSQQPPAKKKSRSAAAARFVDGEAGCDDEDFEEVDEEGDLPKSHLYLPKSPSSHFRSSSLRRRRLHCRKQRVVVHAAAVVRRAGGGRRSEARRCGGELGWWVSRREVAGDGRALAKA